MRLVIAFIAASMLALAGCGSHGNHNNPPVVTGTYDEAGKFPAVIDIADNGDGTYHVTVDQKYGDKIVLDMAANALVYTADGKHSLFLGTASGDVKQILDVDHYRYNLVVSG